jgi:hypothetical protein
LESLKNATLSEISANSHEEEDEEQEEEKQS